MSRRWRRDRIRRRSVASSSRTTARPSGASPPNPVSVRSPGCSAPPWPRCCGERSSSPVPGGPTPACTPGGRSCRSPSRPRGIWRGCRSSLNAMLGPEIVVRGAELRPPGFDARHSARWRAYRYTIVNRPVADPFRARHAWFVPAPLDLRALRLAADPFVGEHDFASFSRKARAGTTTVRRVIAVRVARPRRRDPALRHPRHGVLLAHGALDRGDPGRRRAGETASGRHAHDPARRGPRGCRHHGASPRAVPLGGRLPRPGRGCLGAGDDDGQRARSAGAPGQESAVTVQPSPDAARWVAPAATIVRPASIETSLVRVEHGGRRIAGRDHVGQEEPLAARGLIHRPAAQRQRRTWHRTREGGRDPRARIGGRRAVPAFDRDPARACPGPRR